MDLKIKILLATGLMMAVVLSVPPTASGAVVFDNKIEADNSTNSTTPNLCGGSPPTTPGQWDKCTSSGVFKSVSYCYLAASGSYVYRYDFYTCKPGPSGTIYMYRQNCSGTPVIVDDQVFNPFNPATGRCDLQPPSS